METPRAWLGLALSVIGVLAICFAFCIVLAWICAVLAHSSWPHGSVYFRKEPLGSDWGRMGGVLGWPSQDGKMPAVEGGTPSCFEDGADLAKTLVPHLAGTTP